MAEAKGCTECGALPVKARGLCRKHYEVARHTGAFVKQTAKPTSTARHAPSPNGKGPSPVRTSGGSPTVRKVAEKVGGGIALLNAAGARYIPAFRDDALDPTEIGVLAIGFAEEIVSNKRLLDWYQRIGSEVTGPHTKMGAALAYVALPRLARRGFIPQEVADEMTLILFAVITAEPEELITKADEAPPGGSGATVPTSTPQAGAPAGQLPLVPVDLVDEPEPVRA